MKGNCDMRGAPCLQIDSTIGYNQAKLPGSTIPWLHDLQKDVIPLRFCWPMRFVRLEDETCFDNDSREVCVACRSFGWLLRLAPVL